MRSHAFLYCLLVAVSRIGQRTLNVRFESTHWSRCVVICVSLYQSNTDEDEDAALHAIQRRYVEQAATRPTNSSEIRLPTITNPTPKLVTPTPAHKRPEGRHVTAAGDKPKPKPHPPSALDIPPEVSERRIAAYHNDALKRCLADYANDTHQEGYYCPCLPTEFRKWLSLHRDIVILFRSIVL